ncbi:MAG: TldD/PmbA family protein [Clostridia bacterium]|jgi:PmbA protein|nr:TldD/PmbA family protein [Clostridia bacterium]
MDNMMKLADFILAEAKSLGADYCQCTVSESEKREFNVDGGRFSLMRTLFDRGVNVTVLKGQRKGTVQINRFDEDAVRAAVADSVAASESAEPDPAWQFAEGPVDESYIDGAPECDTEALFARTKELMADVTSRHPKILMEQMITEHDAHHAVYKNSQGVTYRTASGAYHFSLMYSAHEGEKSSSFYGSDVTLATLDKPVIDCALIERELSAVEKQIETQPLVGKFIGTAVMAPMALLETVVMTILSNFVSDMSLIDGTSIWKDKLGEQVADPRLTITFDPHAKHVVGGQHYTGEGYPAQGYDLIREGRLTSFALSQYGANKTGGKRAACSSWEGSITAGEKTLDEIISGVERGVLVMRFSGGQPAASGEFSGVAKNGFLIENGKITCALSETMISACVPDMLNNIRDISCDVLQDGSLSVPYIAFDGVTISGQ